MNRGDAEDAKKTQTDYQSNGPLSVECYTATAPECKFTKRMINENRINSNDSDEVCPICFDTGTQLIPGRGAVTCPCRLTNRQEKLETVARIPRRYADCTFESFRSAPGTSQDTAVLYARSLVNEYPAVDRGLLLMGSAGVGKTHLAVAIIRGLIAKGFACLFCEFGSLLKEIQDSYNPVSKSSEMRVLAPVYQADVLVLDELGATVPTDWVRDTMYQIINKRYNDNRLTIFTTNFLDEVRQESKDGPPEARSFSTKGSAERRLDTLEERIGVRLRSRLHEMCMKVVLSGEDYRTHMGNRRFGG
jgi:DNA replication protein DnaC